MHTTHKDKNFFVQFKNQYPANGCLGVQSTPYFNQVSNSYRDEYLGKLVTNQVGLHGITATVYFRDVRCQNEQVCMRTSRATFRTSFKCRVLKRVANSLHFQGYQSHCLFAIMHRACINQKNRTGTKTFKQKKKIQNNKVKLCKQTAYRNPQQAS